VIFEEKKRKENKKFNRFIIKRAETKEKKWKATTAKYRLTHKQNISNQANTSQTISEDIDNLPLGSFPSPLSLEDNCYFFNKFL
jgi:hypothetical protein